MFGGSGMGRACRVAERGMGSVMMNDSECRIQASPRLYFPGWLDLQAALKMQLDSEAASRCARYGVSLRCPPPPMSSHLSSQ